MSFAELNVRTAFSYTSGGKPRRRKSPSGFRRFGEGLYDNGAPRANGRLAEHLSTAIVRSDDTKTLTLTIPTLTMT